MSDTMTMYAGDKQTVIDIDPQPDPKHPNKYLIKSQNSVPLCCELLLKEHAYNIVLPPGSYIIIEADSAELFKKSRCDDHITFTLPSNNASEFYLEQYFASVEEISPHTVLALRYHEREQLISAALYPRDLESLPTPFFITQDGKTAVVATKGMHETADSDSKAEYVHYPSEIELIMNSIYKPADGAKIEVDPHAPKEKWF